MRRLASLAALSLFAGCADQGEGLPVQEPDQVASAFRAAIRGCSAGLTPEGSIDQAAMRAQGWRAVNRLTNFELEDKAWPPDSYPDLRPMEYEASEWQRAGIENPIELIRHEETDRLIQDNCNVAARTRNRIGAGRVVEAMAAFLGRRPDRSGELPRGGDFLTPRFDKPWTGYYWALPRNDVYVLINDAGYARLEVVAMPDRGALDPYSSDRPDHRIPVNEGTS